MNSCIPRKLFDYPRYWAAKYLPVPVLPMTAGEMADLGWDSCDIIIVTGDAYVDHPSFGMALIGRVLEAQGFRVGIIAQPDWRNKHGFMALGKPNLFFGVTSGNMDSMVNRYTANARIRSNDAYSPDDAPGKRPDRAVIVYAQRCREAYPDVPIVLGGIEASLRRVAHFDYWSEKIRRSILLDAKADILVYGNGERPVIEIAHRAASGEPLRSMADIRGTAVVCAPVETDCADPAGFKTDSRWERRIAAPRPNPNRNDASALPLPSFETVSQFPESLNELTRIIREECHPVSGRILIQNHGLQAVRINPPAFPLTTEEMDWVYELPYSRKPHPVYAGSKMTAHEMIQHSITIMRGCFGGCAFCSITEHEGRRIQNRSEASVLREIETIRDTVPGFTGFISDIGGPTANMYRMGCRDSGLESACRRLSCLYPAICPNLNADHGPLIRLYRKARELPGIKKVFVSSGVRHDLALKSSDYIRELAVHHTSGLLKVAPEHTRPEPLACMLKPGIGVFESFKRVFERMSRQAGKEQYLVPYFIAAHPGTTDEDMIELVLWMKRHRIRVDQVQTFLPLPMTIATAVYYSGRKIKRKPDGSGDAVFVPKGLKVRRLQKAFLRYHDPANWPMLRAYLRSTGRQRLIGNGPEYIVPAIQPAGFRSTSDRHEKGKQPGSKGIGAIPSPR